MALLLGRSEVSDLLDLRQAMRVLEQTFRDQAAGQVKQVPPLRFMNRGMRMVVGGLEAQNTTGFRVSVTGGKAIALLFEISSGDLLAVIGYPFSNLRIAATVGLAIERLSNPRASSIALIGSGRLAMPILQAAVSVRAVQSVWVYSRNPENRQSFASRAKDKLNINIRAVPTAAEAIDEAEIVLVSTNSPAPALSGRWLQPGVSVFGVGRPNEFDDDVYLNADLIVVTSKTHELGYYDTQLDQPLVRLCREGKLSWNEVAEFGDVLAGKLPLPEDSGRLSVFRDSQGGYGDLALAVWAYDEARRRNLGEEISTE
jgi:ornithine cyclodeaminase/alanine dehydrogenase-like protein (mu-crystallin family)